VVRGFLEAVSPEYRAFLAGDVYLAQVRYTEGDVPIAYLRLDPDRDVKATLRNESNEFAILDVPPGDYGLIVHTVAGDYVVPDSEGGYLEINVLADQTLDLGVLEMR
jgi:hypothetical protein